MLRLSILAALLLAGCAATNPAVSQAKSSTYASGAKTVPAKSAACYKSSQSVSQGDYTDTVSDSEC